MKPNTPILMLSLMIPVVPGVSAEQIMNVIGGQVYEAIQQLEAHQRAEAAAEPADLGDPEAIPQEEFNASVPRETFEAYTDDTKEDLLARLGYAAEA
ncbi:MAG TPA: hypothetical protein VKT77_20955 [Chthonomonadaceae bacterium]|nr:hypothetical protein [Chthonomonadaceae bacterium]